MNKVFRVTFNGEHEDEQECRKTTDDGMNFNDRLSWLLVGVCFSLSLLLVYYMHR